MISLLILFLSVFLKPCLLFTVIIFMQYLLTTSCFLRRNKLYCLLFTLTITHLHLTHTYTYTRSNYTLSLNTKYILTHVNTPINYIDTFFLPFLNNQLIKLISRLLISNPTRLLHFIIYKNYIINIFIIKFDLLILSVAIKLALKTPATTCDLQDPLRVHNQRIVCETIPSQSDYG